MARVWKTHRAEQYLCWGTEGRVPAENRWQDISVLRRLLLSANADSVSIGEYKANVKVTKKTQWEVEHKCLEWEQNGFG